MKNQEDILLTIMGLDRDDLQRLIDGDFKNLNISKLFPDDEYGQKVKDAQNYARREYATRTGKAMTIDDELALFGIFKSLDEESRICERSLLHIMRHPEVTEEYQLELEHRHTSKKFGEHRTAQDWRDGKR